MVYEDLVGKKYGEWTVLSFFGRKNNGYIYWNCICKCGKEKTVMGTSLKRGGSNSCKPCSSKSHGLNNHPLYASINQAEQRCNNPKHPKYKDYGGRKKPIKFKFKSVPAGIRWVEKNLGLRPKGMTLDRINNDGHYEPGNLQWATRRTQVGNRRVKSKTGYQGVSINGKNFAAIINYNKKYRYIGTFPTAYLASLAYNSCREVLETSSPK